MLFYIVWSPPYKAKSFSRSLSAEKVDNKTQIEQYLSQSKVYYFMDPPEIDFLRYSPLNHYFCKNNFSGKIASKNLTWRKEFQIENFPKLIHQYLSKALPKKVIWDTNLW